MSVENMTVKLFIGQVRCQQSNDANTVESVDEMFVDTISKRILCIWRRGGGG